MSKKGPKGNIIVIIIYPKKWKVKLKMNCSLCVPWKKYKLAAHICA